MNNNHISGPLISAYADNALSSNEAAELEHHLFYCELCKLEIENVRDLKRRVGTLTAVAAPQTLLIKLKNTYLKPSWLDRIRSTFQLAPLWKPAGVLALLSLLMGVWFVRRGAAPEETMSLEPLLAAHSRYQAEDLVPSGDMMASDFSAQLAVYYGNNQ